MWAGLPEPSNADTVGKGFTAIEDAARLIYASLYACGEVTTDRIGEYEVRAVVKPQWFVCYIFIWFYVMACVILAAGIFRKELYVPIPKSWYDGYQMALCDLQQTQRGCADPFEDAPTGGIGAPLYNIVDNGPSHSFDHLGITTGPVTKRVRMLRGSAQMV